MHAPLSPEPNVPIPDTYWVAPGRLLAGEYPGGWTVTVARERLRLLVEAGVTLFLDLTEAGELPGYARLLPPGVSHLRLPIPDMGVPTDEEMRRIQDTLDAALDAGQVVYVHCWAGLGRTGMVIGCYLARHGMSGDEALAEIARLRRALPSGARPSPQTEAQREMVRRCAGR